MKRKTRIFITALLPALLVGGFWVGKYVFEHKIQSACDRRQLVLESKNCDRLLIMFYSEADNLRLNKTGASGMSWSDFERACYRPIVTIEGKDKVAEFVDTMQFVGPPGEPCECACPPFWELWQGDKKVAKFYVKHVESTPYINYRGRHYHIKPAAAAKLQALYKQYKIPDYQKYLSEQ